MAQLSYIARRPAHRPGRAHAFTLIEVMVAMAIFFMGMFAILGLFSSSIHGVLLLRKSGPTAAMVAAELSLTNQLDEGEESGNFGDVYQGYNWNYVCEEVGTNGLYRVDFQVTDPNGNPQSHLSALFFRPDTGPKQLGGRAAFMNR